MTAPIDASMYLSMIDSIGTYPTRASLDQTVTAAYTDPGDFEEPVDLSNYYSELANSDLFTEVANNVAESAEALDNAIITALENGMGVQDAVNLNCALNAYKANCRVAQSTFELKI